MYRTITLFEHGCLFSGLRNYSGSAITWSTLPRWPNYGCYYPNIEDGDHSAGPSRSEVGEVADLDPELSRLTQQSFTVSGNFFISMVGTLLVQTDAISLVTNWMTSYEQQLMIREMLSKMRVLYPQEPGGQRQRAQFRVDVEVSMSEKDQHTSQELKPPLPPPSSHKGVLTSTSPTRTVRSETVPLICGVVMWAEGGITTDRNGDKI